MDRKQLELRLTNWAEEYGGGRYEDIGYPGRNMLQSLVEHRGFLPSSGGFIAVPINTPADEVEDTVRCMEASGYDRPGLVLRCEYFLVESAMETKLANLARVGVAIKRPTYYDYLAIAKAFVMGQLSRRRAA